MKARALILATMAALLGGCAAGTSVVDGTAQETPLPATGSRLAAGEPCELLTERDLAALGLAGDGEFEPGESNRLTPPSCTWNTPDDPTTDPLTVAYGSSFSLARYTDFAEPVRTELIGGRPWAQFPDPVAGGSVCQLGTELDNGSFVVVLSSSLRDTPQACALADAAALYVSSHLPG